MIMPFATKFISSFLSLFCLIILFSCGGKSLTKVEQKTKSERTTIKNVLKNSTDCPTAKVTNYTINLEERQLLEIGLSSCTVENADAEATRLNSLLNQNIDYFCKIKRVNYEFVIDNYLKVVSFRNCEKMQ